MKFYSKGTGLDSRDNINIKFISKVLLLNRKKIQKLLLLFYVVLAVKRNSDYLHENEFGPKH